MSTVLNSAARALLQAPNHCVVATVNADGTPQLSSVWVTLEDDHVAFSTYADSRKARNLLRDPRVVLHVINAFNPYQTVTVYGRARPRDGADGAAFTDRLALRYSGELYRGHHVDRTWVVFDVDAERVTHYTSELYP